eukprot:TRINITY_DN7132_c0_g1_i1.p1 TRINITY_DN7132_c0_g1~~TRINITY_DN7132_c0_g1_i1.p1  ORF type:complete len:361 (+),score=78.26 TRINITY_DN7132_c0_g1_i1:22-1083(+)
MKATVFLVFLFGCTVVGWIGTVTGIVPTYPFHVRSNKGYFEWENNNPNIALIGVFPNQTLARDHNLRIDFMNITFTQSLNDTSQVRTDLPYTIDLTQFKSNWTINYSNTSDGQSLNYTIYDPISKVTFQICYWIFNNDKILPVVPTKYDVNYTLAAGTAKYSFSITIDNSSFLYDPENGVNMTETIEVAVSQPSLLSNEVGIYGRIPNTVASQLFTWNLNFSRYGSADGTYSRARFPVPIDPALATAAVFPVVNYFYVFVQRYEYDPDLSVLFTGTNGGEQSGGDGSGTGGAGDGTNNKQGGSNKGVAIGVTIGVVGGVFICVVIVIVVVLLIVWKREQIARKARTSFIGQNM